MRKHLILLCIMAILLPLHTTAQSFKKEIYAKPELWVSPKTQLQVYTLKHTIS